jgi:hypothetical protein
MWQIVPSSWRKLALRLLPGSVLEPLRNIRMRAHRKQALKALAAAPPYPKLPHGLAGELIVSLTSYPARFETLSLTIASLVRQTVRHDRLVLWLTADDASSIPEEIRAFTDQGLEIRVCDDLKSYKKLVPALEIFPEAYIVTADDDLYFPPRWLEIMVTEVGTEREILAWRVHRMVRTVDGDIAPYLRWQLDVQDDNTRQPSADLVPTSGSGALYPPRSLHHYVTDRASFERLCPDGDDLWFFWCARMAGTPVKKVGARFDLVTWPGSQDQSLWDANRLGRNDRMIRALTNEFGIECLGLDQVPAGKAGP